MHHSYTSRTLALGDGLAERHRYMFGHAFAYEGTSPPTILPSRLLITSVEDLSYLAVAQLNDGRYGDSSILSPQGITELHDPTVRVNGGDAHHAIGWLVGTFDDEPLIDHGGLLYNFRSQIFLLPEKGWAVILLANASGFE